jgi:hypothetical protein
MTDPRYGEELFGTLSLMRDRCAQKGLKVYPGWVDGRSTVKIYWKGEDPYDWRTFIDFAASLSVQLTYLHAHRLDETDISGAGRNPSARSAPSFPLEQARARVGEIAWIELGFFSGPAYHAYAKTEPWYDSLCDSSGGVIAPGGRE